MKTTVSIYDFRNAFQSIRPDNFSYDGLEILFNGLEEFEDDTGEELELDVIAICCDFCEMTPQEIIDCYSLDIEDDGNQLNNVLDHLNDMTWILGTTAQGTIVFRQF